MKLENMQISPCTLILIRIKKQITEIKEYNPQLEYKFFKKDGYIETLLVHTYHSKILKIQKIL